MSAERARERQQWLPIEGFLRALVWGGIPTFKPKHRPKISKQVQKILEDELKTAKGEM